MKSNPRLLVTATALAVAACSPSDSAVEQAVRDHWPNEQAGQRGRAAFYFDHAASFEKGARMSARISARLGTESSISSSHQQVADEDRARADEAQWIADAELEDVHDVSCAPAAPNPGYNCEMTVTLRGKDGEEARHYAGYRFDTVDGRLAVVGGL
ncbi:MAG: hypothetical protein KDC54_21100 [Lewinella sp.]|nr:hypothetical protein [Lewinella sp.]